MSAGVTATSCHTSGMTASNQEERGCGVVVVIGSNDDKNIARALQEPIVSGWIKDRRAKPKSKDRQIVARGKATIQSVHIHTVVPGSITAQAYNTFSTQLD